MKLKDACSLEEKLWQTGKGLHSQSYGFSSSHLWMWELDHNESWALKNWCIWTGVLDKTLLKSLLDCKEIKPVNQSWIFIGRTDVKTEAPILWPPDAKNWLIRKDPDAGKDWKQEEKGTIEGWDSWMASPTWWTWVWASSGSWWWTGRPGVLQFMGSQRVGHDWATELNWHSQRLQHSQWGRSWCFPGILLLFLWSSGYWQFDLWFLCLF